MDENEFILSILGFSKHDILLVLNK